MKTSANKTIRPKLLAASLMLITGGALAAPNGPASYYGDYQDPLGLETPSVSTLPDDNEEVETAWPGSSDRSGPFGGGSGSRPMDVPSSNAPGSNDSRSRRGNRKKEDVANDRTTDRSLYYRQDSGLYDDPRAGGAYSGGASRTTTGAYSYDDPPPNTGRDRNEGLHRLAYDWAQQKMSETGAQMALIAYHRAVRVEDGVTPGGGSGSSGSSSGGGSPSGGSSSLSLIHI